MMRNDEIKISRELAEQILPELRAGSYEEQELRALLAAPVVEHRPTGAGASR